MKLRAVRLHNVRRFAGRGVAIEGMGDGVNVLSAANEHGKSTSFDALHALFFQPHSGTPKAVQSLRPYSGGSPLVEADIETEAGRFRLTKQFYAGKRAGVVDLASGRIMAQADEAERFIAELVHGGSGGPAGLLWVRQGITGIENRSPSEKEEERKAREGVLASVQGEVEALTGGRRMAQILDACAAELGELATATGRPRAGGPYAEALEERDRLASEEARLEADVRDLRNALDARRKARARLAELEDPAETAARQQARVQAEQALAQARAHGEKLHAAEARESLARHNAEAARAALDTFRRATQRVLDLQSQETAAIARRDDALARRLEAVTASDNALAAAEQAEVAEQEARGLLARLDRALRAREAAERLKQLRTRLAEAEAAHKQIEDGQAALRVAAVPADTVRELEGIETELAGLRAAEAARATTLRIDYEDGAKGQLTDGGAPLPGGTERPIHGTAQFDIEGIGTLTIRSTREGEAADGKLAKAVERRRSLLEQLGAESLRDVRERQAAASAKAIELETARRHLALLAPQGVAELRAEIARLQDLPVPEDQTEANPEAARQAHAAAGEKLAAARLAAREARPVRDKAEAAVIDAEKALSSIAAERAVAEAALGAEEGRADRAGELQRVCETAEAAFAEAKAAAETLRAGAPDIDTVEATLRRTASAVDATAKEAASLREQLADLNGSIRTRTDGAVEEIWRETAERRAAADTLVRRFEMEVAALTRLRRALEDARTAARDLYFEPVMNELRPLMGLLFDDVSVSFNDATLLPELLRRNGQDEPVDVLSGGMREQLAILTRLAFARLLARDGRPAPVILDDALVYSDDDRIEKMFDALHRQSRDQQIIVFSCRQRAFERLGGNRLQMTEWRPEQG
ncbi:MAG: DNA-binding protein [Aquamicrobium sp.]|nr:DNA-binding protein [Aquamicrobium sp.]